VRRKKEREPFPNDFSAYEAEPSMTEKNHALHRSDAVLSFFLRTAGNDPFLAMTTRGQQKTKLAEWILNPPSTKAFYHPRSQPNFSPTFPFANYINRKLNPQRFGNFTP